jgi:hypothetical protein
MRFPGLLERFMGMFFQFVVPEFGGWGTELGIIRVVGRRGEVF